MELCRAIVKNDLLVGQRAVTEVLKDRHFELQQYCTNSDRIRNELQKLNHDEKMSEIVKLLGLNWNCKTDAILANARMLDIECDTKRKIFKSVAENFDLFNFHGPLLNRAKLLLHK